MRAAAADLKSASDQSPVLASDQSSVLARALLAIARGFWRWVKNVYGPDAIDRGLAHRWYWGL